MQLFITISKDGQGVEIREGRRVRFLVKTPTDYNTAMRILGEPDELDICGSSSIDFPEDWTDNKDVIELCHAILASHPNMEADF